MTLYVVPIVEGQTEAGCVERLLQRVWNGLLASQERLQVLQPSRGKRDQLIDPGRSDLSDKIEEAHAKLSQQLRRDPAGRGLLLLLLDAEGDPPCTLAPRLLQSARDARGDADIACVLAKRMLENWITAGASSLAGVNGLPAPLRPPENPEDFSGAAWLDEQLRSRNRARKYKKTVDAVLFVQSMNLAESRANCPSFDKLCRELDARLPRPLEETEQGGDSAPPEPPAPSDTGTAP
jgi:hypothetical protein